MSASYTAKDDAIKERVPPKTIVAMDAASSLTCNIQPRQGAAIPDTLTLHSRLQAPHAIVDHRGNDCDIELLRGNGRAWNDIVEELLSAASLTTGLIPGLS